MREFLFEKQCSQKIKDYVNLNFIVKPSEHTLVTMTLVSQMGLKASTSMQVTVIGGLLIASLVTNDDKTQSSIMEKR